MSPDRPRSLRILRAVLAFMAVLLALGTVDRLGTVELFGVAGGGPPAAGIAWLAVTGSAFLLACVAAFFLLARPARLHWWLVSLLPLFAAANIASAMVVIPEDHVTVWLVLDVYLFNGLLTLVAMGLWLKRPVRVYFKIRRPATTQTRAA